MEKQNQQAQQAQQTPKNYRPSDEFRKWVQSILGVKPYAEIAGIFQILAKEVMSEDEINSILGEMGKAPYNDVYQFFIALQQLVKEDIPEPAVDAKKEAEKLLKEESKKAAK